MNLIPARALVGVVLGVWLCSISVPEALAAVTDPWQQWLQEDLNASESILAEQYIYSLTEAGDPDWQRRWQQAFSEARGAAETVTDFAGYRAVMQRLLSQFEDVHLRAQFGIETATVRWPGFLLRYIDGRYVVSHSTLPRLNVGAQISHCGGRALDDRIDQLAAVTNHLPGLKATREWLAPELLVDRGQRFIDRLETCLIDGVPTVLQWMPTSQQRLSGMQAVHDPAPPSVGLEVINAELAWIRLPSMAPRNEAQAEAYRQVVERASGLRNMPRVVFDVRGNGGGPYPWFMAMLRSLYGVAYVDDRAIARLEIRPVFVPGSYQPSEPDPQHPLSPPADLPMARTVAAVNAITLDNGRTVTALDPVGARFAPPSAASEPLFQGQLFVLTDGGCGSACLSFIDELKRLDGVIHIGTPTWADRRSGSPRPHALPSGLTTLLVPSMLRMGRVRPDNVAWEPDRPFPGDVQDTAAVRAWVLAEWSQSQDQRHQAAMHSTVRRAHRGRFNGRSIRYQSVYEEYVVNNSSDQPEAILSSISYVAEDPHQSSQRPVIFVFQGGPGSSAIWSHLGLLGPKRVRIDDPAQSPTAPPFVLEANPYSLLDVADLVFIDPVNTGYSRVLPGGAPRALLNSIDDADSVAQLINQWLTRYQRWNAPRYVMGSSYGTTRSVMVADALMGGVLPPHGRLGSVTLNGLIILGPTFSRQAVFAGNHRNHQTDLPTQAATAWYHARLGDRWARVEDVVEAARIFAWTDYGQALDAGYSLGPDQAQAVAESLAELTGVSAQTWLDHRLRLDGDQFRRLLLAEEGLQVGHFDSRFVLPAQAGANDPVADDPAMAQYTPAFVAAFNEYLYTDLGLSQERPYRIIDWKTVNFVWDYGLGPGRQRPRNDAEILARVLRRTPDLEVFIGAGYYDLGTPFAAAEYALAQVPLDRDRLQFHYYPSGHSPYLGEDNIARLTQELRTFVRP